MQTHQIGNEALTAWITPFGAALTDLRLRGWPRPLILGFEQIEDYRDTDHYSGAVIGRHANRIAHGRATIDGQTVMLPCNGGAHHLHGGATGLAKQDWTLESAEPAAVTMTLLSADGHEGYPGDCRLTVRYEVLEPATLQLSFNAVADRTTLVNLCHHPYFNFSGEPTIVDHHLEIAASTYLVSNEELVPTGEIRRVDGSSFDFRRPRRVGEPRPAPGFNNNFCLATSPRRAPQFAARLSVPNGPSMELWTTQTGLHLYDGYKLRPNQRGLDGCVYGPNAGLCLEAQNWPDSPNHPDFPSAILPAGEVYRHATQYRFAPPQLARASDK